MLAQKLGSPISPARDHQGGGGSNHRMFANIIQNGDNFWGSIITKMLARCTDRGSMAGDLITKKVISKGLKSPTISLF